MLTEPADLDHAALRHALERHWRLRDVELRFLPLGFGGHHWRAGDRFVTVDDLAAGHHAVADEDEAFAALERAYGTAAALRDDALLPFVVAPVRDCGGHVVRRLSERYAVSVVPWIDGESAGWGPYESDEERRLMCRLVAQLHAATAHVPAGLPRTDDFAVPSRASLEDALLDLDRTWTTGPFAEPARQLLTAARDSVDERLREYDRLAASAEADAAGWVITHGEPHRANVLRGPGGRRSLIDWDTTLLAPRERDLFMILDEARTGWDEYAAVVPAELDEGTLRLYRSWWELADIAVFVHLFRQPHETTEQTAESWRILAANLAVSDA